MKKYNATVMVVEDDPNDQFLIEHAFRGIGVTDPIHYVGDGAEAIAYMLGEGKYADREKYAYPTFIITDLKMPGTDGFAVLEFLKSNPEWKVIPTIVLSASSDLDDIKKSYMLGASSYHIKPNTAEELRQQLAVINAYWMTCQVPQVDVTGRQLHTNSHGKLGERFPQASDEPTDTHLISSAAQGIVSRGRASTNGSVSKRGPRVKSAANK
jgi:CheY-like chemotaxis protein